MNIVKTLRQKILQAFVPISSKRHKPFVPKTSFITNCNYKLVVLVNSFQSALFQNPGGGLSVKDLRTNKGTEDNLVSRFYQYNMKQEVEKAS